MRGIEGLPFRYVILALIAVLVIGIVIEVNKTTSAGINTVTGKMMGEINTQISGQFDTNGPKIGKINVWNNYNGICASVELSDESGIDKAGIFIKRGSNEVSINLNYKGKDNGYEVWRGCSSPQMWGNLYITAWAIDGSPHHNENTKTEQISI